MSVAILSARPIIKKNLSINEKKESNMSNYIIDTSITDEDAEKLKDVGKTKAEIAAEIEREELNRVIDAYLEEIGYVDELKDNREKIINSPETMQRQKFERWGLTADEQNDYTSWINEKATAGKSGSKRYKRVVEVSPGKFEAEDIDMGEK